MGSYSKISPTPTPVKHHIWREFENGRYRWACDCKCSERGYFHVHQALMTGIERAFDLVELLGGETYIEPPTITSRSPTSMTSRGTPRARARLYGVWHRRGLR